jgi:hypothetical protein
MRRWSRALSDARPQKPASDCKLTAASASDLLAYAAIALFVALSYVLMLGRYAEYLKTVLPHGDWFSYTVSWFSNIDFYRGHGYLLTLVAMLLHPGNWYRLMNLAEMALAPVMVKQPYVICVVNYVLFGVATAAFYRLARRLGLTMHAALAVALIPWLWPVNYGFADYTSLPVTGVDAAFNAALFWAVAQTYIFAFDLRPPAPAASAELRSAAKRRRAASAVVTGLVVGFAVWGRGNSLPVVGLVVLWPALLALRFAWQDNERRLWIDVFIAGGVAGLMAAEFYAQYWTGLVKYYGPHVAYIEAHRFSVAGARQFLLNVPGFMYWRAEDSALCIGLTFASHLFALLTLAVAWWPKGRFSTGTYFWFRQLVAGGAVIYFGTYLVDMTLFANDQPGFSIYQSLLVWRPMLIGLSLMTMALATEMLRRLEPRFVRAAIVPLAAAALGWGYLWTRINTPLDPTHQWPSPQTVERFALNVENFADNGPVAMLWYRGWNDRILDYYRLMNDLPAADLLNGRHLKYIGLIAAAPADFATIFSHPWDYYRRRLDDWHLARQFSADHYDDMWSMADYSADKRARVLRQVEYQFGNASLIVLPEYLDQYRSNEPYAFYKFKDDWAAWLNSGAAPRFRVTMILNETPAERLLVLRPASLANGQGDPFRLPYGYRPEKPPADYSDAVVRFR